MSMALDGLSDAALGDAIKRCMAGLGGGLATVSEHDPAQLGAALRRQLPVPAPFERAGFHHRRSGSPEGVPQRMGAILVEWWESLQDHPGDRAALRRADELSEAISVPAFHRLRWRIDELLAKEGRRLSAGQRERLPVAAALAARVREPHGTRDGLIGQIAGSGSGTAPVSALRFRRLLQAREPDDLFRQLRRVLAMLDGRADLIAMSDDVLNWDERRRKRWAYAYYGAASKA